MSFPDPQIRKLKARLKPQHVKMREADGVTLHYLEGWHVVAEANRIFGFDGWDREILANSCVWTKQMSARYCAAYVAKVRITVRAGDHLVIREGSGAGESNEASPGQAHDRAAKAAETDATKRALTTFGNCFGLTLYAGNLLNDRAAAGKSNKTASEAKQEPQTLTRSNGSSHDHEFPHKTVAATIQETSSMPYSEASPSLESTHESVNEQGKKSVVDKSTLAIPEPRRIRDPDHLKFVAELPCIICGREPCEAHHLRYVQPRALGRKSSDAYAVPLCALHHRELHARGNERAWWVAKGRDPLPIADELWRQSAGKRLGEPKLDEVLSRHSALTPTSLSNSE
jgi:DNA recombination protein Rad52